MSRRVNCVLLVLACSVGLVGCADKPLEQRIEDRDACVAAGGVYVEWTPLLAIYASRCNLTTPDQPGGSDS